MIGKLNPNFATMPSMAGPGSSSIEKRVPGKLSSPLTGNLAAMFQRQASNPILPRQISGNNTDDPLADIPTIPTKETTTEEKPEMSHVALSRPKATRRKKKTATHEFKSMEVRCFFFVHVQELAPHI